MITKFCSVIESSHCGWSKYVPNKSQMAEGRHLEKSKNQCHRNRLTDFDNIWHADVPRPSGPH